MLNTFKLAGGMLLTVTASLVHAESKFEGSSRDPIITPLIVSGSHEDKLDIVIIGDGFADNPEDQRKFNRAVEEVEKEIFKNGIYAEVIGALNVYKVNTFSIDSGASEATVDSSGNLQYTTKNETVLNITPNGDWGSCWFTWDNEGADRLLKIQRELFPFRDRVWVIVNSDMWGGCNNGGLNTFVTTLSPGYVDALRHESGHNTVSLCDEYDAAVNDSSAIYCQNLAKINDNKWDEFIDVDRVSIPSTFDYTIMSATKTVGKFPFQGQNKNNVFRSVFNSTMRGNAKEFGPVNDKLIRSQLRSYWNYDFSKVISVDFSGDGLDDLLVHSGRVLYLYKSNGIQFEFYSSISDVVKGGGSSWQLRPGDELYKTDLNGDGKDDLVIVNMKDWVKPYLALMVSTGEGYKVQARYDQDLPGWDSMKEGDEFLVADYNGDGKDDLVVLNTKDWAVGYLLMLESNGNAFSVTKRYDDVLPGWDSMRPHDELWSADINGDGKEGIIIRNFGDWDKGYVGVIESDGKALSMVRRYDGKLPNWGRIARDDVLTVLDYNGDGKSDIVIKNCKDWDRCYFGALESNSVGFSNAVISIESVPGWEFGINDEFYRADINGDGKDDLYIYNSTDWDDEYLGLISSKGDGSFGGGWIKGRKGQWNFGSKDKFIVSDFSGENGWDDLIVYNNDWLGTMRSTSSGVVQTSINNRWITDVEYHKNGWW